MHIKDVDVEVKLYTIIIINLMKASFFLKVRCFNNNHERIKNQLIINTIIILRHMLSSLGRN